MDVDVPHPFEPETHDGPPQSGLSNAELEIGADRRGRRFLDVHGQLERLDMVPTVESERAHTQAVAHRGDNYIPGLSPAERAPAMEPRSPGRRLLEPPTTMRGSINTALQIEEEDPEDMRAGHNPVPDAALPSPARQLQSELDHTLVLG